MASPPFSLDGYNERARQFLADYEIGDLLGLYGLTVSAFRVRDVPLTLRFLSPHRVRSGTQRRLLRGPAMPREDHRKERRAQGTLARERPEHS